MLGWRISLFKARLAAIVIVCQRQDRLITVIREPRRHPAVVRRKQSLGLLEANGRFQHRVKI